MLFVPLSLAGLSINLKSPTFRSFSNWPIKLLIVLKIWGVRGGQLKFGIQLLKIGSAA